MGKTISWQRTLIGASLFSLANINVYADQSSAPLEAPDLTGRWLYNITLDHINIDSNVAPGEGIGDSAFAFGFEGEYFFNSRFSTSLGLSFLSYDERYQFTQPTEDQYGRRETSSSDASAIPLYAELGYKQFFTGQAPTYITARMGVSTLLASEHSIANCSNCSSFDIDVSGGLYAAFGAGIRTGQSWGLGIMYKNYLTGDLENSVGVSLTYGY